MSNLTENSIKVLNDRYLLKDENQNIIEKPDELFLRVAKQVASAEVDADSKMRYTDSFYEMLSNLEFLPNTPCLVNSGKAKPQLFACFVIPVGDSIEEIFDAVKKAAIIHKTGGGTGFSFTHLRPEGSLVKGTGGTSSGPVSFMKLFDTATQVVKQGGYRRGANMGIIDVWHPDIEKFIRAKKGKNALECFNLSVSMDDKFMKAVMDGTNKISENGKTIHPIDIFKDLCKYAWKNGEPGVLFMDTINRNNPFDRIEATNPCGEQPLLPYESCVLGSINLGLMVLNDGNIDYDRIKRITRLAVRFLDNCITVNCYPFPEIEAMTKRNRKIGLGVMGFADMLVRMEIRYGSDRSFDIAEEVMSCIQTTALSESISLADEKGSCSIKGLRNATRTTIAPTGSISMIADCSSGIEPIISLAYQRRIDGHNEKLTFVNPNFKEALEIMGTDVDKAVNYSLTHGSIKHADFIPKEIKDIFRIAHDIRPEDHVEMQSRFQKFVDNAVSKTINLSDKATLEDVEEAFKKAWQKGCKGITVYRDGSRKAPIIIGKDGKTKVKECVGDRCEMV